MQSHLKPDTVINVLLPALGAASGCKLEKVDQQGFSIGQKMLNSIFSPQILHHHMVGHTHQTANRPKSEIFRTSNTTANFRVLITF